MKKRNGSLELVENIFIFETEIDPPENVVSDSVWEVEVTFQITDIKIENDGIGPYEYWGSMEYDHGSNYVEDFDIDIMEYFVYKDGDEIDLKLSEEQLKILKENAIEYVNEKVDLELEFVEEDY